MKLLSLAALLALTTALPDGAPIDACEDMTPQHFVDPSDGNPYAVTTDSDGDGTYTGKLKENSCYSTADQP